MSSSQSKKRTSLLAFGFGPVSPIVRSSIHPLNEIDASQAHNKRRRLLHSVVVIKPSAEHIAEFLDTQCLSTFKHLRQSLSEEPDDRIQPALPSIPTSHKAVTTSRSGRIVKQVQHSITNWFHSSSDDSNDEGLSRPRSSLVKARTAAKSEESDYEQAHGLGEHEEESESDPVTSHTESSIAAPTDDDSDADPTIRSLKSAKGKKGTAHTDVVVKPALTAKATHVCMARLLKRSKGEVRGLDTSLPPLFQIDEIFLDLTQKALKLNFDIALKTLSARPLRIATMCSGTESPLLAMDMIRDALKGLRSNDTIEVEHLFSAEIVPYKQAYIERNFAPPLIFRDITEFIDTIDDEIPMATTAYGAKVALPTGPDIVVAGTSCVDFSRLNNNKKGLGDGGESDRTWHGAMAYCRKYRPAIILFENIVGADWDLMRKHYQEIDYDGEGVFVDTKDYYIPHTRQRGYMICFDKQRPGYTKGLGAAWQKLMVKFKRLASSPVSSFLLPNDQVVSRHQARNDEQAREVDWSKCEITQMQYRQETRIGNARPFTQWQESGTMQIPENGHPQWYRAQVERVLDTIDGCILRKALEKEGMYDARYKTRIWDLSQNIHRDRDRAPFGMTGCITPSGQFFVSDAGRAMAAEETLKLQGLPLDRISFTTESSKEMQDLAGNAMTSTVVGASLLAALITGHRLLETSTISPRNTVMAESVKANMICDGTDFVPPPQTDLVQNTDIRELIRDARRALRRCFCEHGFGRCERDLQRCIDCDHTTCLTCGGNPKHNYRSDRRLNSERISPVTLEERLRSSMPLLVGFDNTIDFRGLFDLKESGSKLVQHFVEAAHEAVSSTFQFSHARRTHCWTVVFSTLADRSHLELVIDDHHAEWRLFAHPTRCLAVDDPIRKLFEQPIAKAQVRDRMLPSGWSWRSPLEIVVPATVTGEGSQVPTWWQRNEMPDFKSHFQWERIRIEMLTDGPENTDQLDGVYQYLPSCGKACDSLYKKLAGGYQDPPLFLFLDPSQTGDAEEDAFVFSHNKAALEYDETRSILARFPASWRPWTSTSKKLISDASIKLGVIKWVSLAANFAARPTQVSFRQPSNVESLVDVSLCTDTISFSTCRLSSTDPFLPDGQDSVDDASFLGRVSWALEALRRQLPDPSWRPLNAACVQGQCRLCAPERPSVRWKLAGDGVTVKPYEEASSAATYERAIKSRRDPLVITTSYNQDGAECNLGVNIMTLAHRAAARLPKVQCEPRAMWRLETSQASTDFVFRPFELIATTDLEPYFSDIGMTIKLFPKQALAVAWMRQQERGVEFLIEEAEEATVKQLKWRAEVRVQVPITVRGGICADHPGFGKTVTSLALVHAGFEDATESDAKADLEVRLNTSVFNGILCTLATLVVCPGTLIKQWTAEACEKLKYRVRHKGRGEIIVINSVMDLDKTTISDFEQARIVFVNRSVLGSEAYVERLANFAGVPGPAAKSGRSLSQWLAFATSQMPEHLRVLRHEGIQRLRALVNSKYQENMSSEEFKASVPSRRLRGQAYIDANMKKASAKNSASKSTGSKSATGTIDTTNIDKPLFEMFYFNRMVVDEFHQYESKEYAAIVALRADKRWGLSATPALGDFYDIAQMAGLLGVTLRIGSDARGIMKFKNVKELRRDMTDFERFDAMRQIPSCSMHHRIHEIDQQFLNAFVRRNIMDMDEMKYDDWLRPVNLDLDHRVVYTELSQHLNSLDMRIKKGKKSQATDRDQRLSQAVASSETAEEALSKAAACYERASDVESIMKPLVEQAESEVNGLLSKFTKAMHDAQSSEPDAFESWVGARLTDRTLGDDSVIAEVRKRINSSNASSMTKTKKPAKGSRDRSMSDVEEDDDENKAGKSKPRVKTSELNTQANRLVVAWRSLRFFQNVQRLQESDDVICDHASCEASLAAADNPGFSSLCGHVVCETCFTKLQTKRCIADGCLAAMDSSHILWAKKMGSLQQSRCTRSGAKMEAALKILDDVHVRREQAILFVQYTNQVDEVERALKTHGIPAMIVKESSRASQQISDFQKSTGETCTVIVLNASDETAAGSNLQNANHVVFFSPLLRDSQYGYDSTMAQAVGRVRRYGQTRKIQVYRVVGLDTIDVDILEHRERRSDALREQGRPAIDKPKSLIDGSVEAGPSTKAQRTQLVKIDGAYSLQPRSWLVDTVETAEEDAADGEKVKRKDRVHGWESFSSLIKWSRAYTEDDG